MPFPTFKEVFKEQEQLGFLEAQGFDLNDAIDQPSKTTEHFAIHDAAHKGKLDIIKRLLDNNISIDLPVVKNDEHFIMGEAPLSIALQANHEKTVVFLVNRGADLNQCDQSGEFPLAHCARLGWKNNTKSLMCLIEKGANINQENLTSDGLFTPGCGPSLSARHMNALMYSLSSINSAALLLEHGANSINSQGRTIFEYCFNQQIRDKIYAKMLNYCLETEELDVTLQAHSFPQDVRKLVCSYTVGYQHFTLFKSSPNINNSLELPSDQQESKRKRKLPT